MSTMMENDARLLKAWLVLVSLTIVSVGAGLWLHLPAKAAGAIAMVVAVIKARQVLDHFLDLRRAAGPWRTMLTALLMVVAGGIVMIGLI